MKQKKSGLDIDLGNRCSKIAFDWAKKSFTNRPSGSGNPLPSVEGGFSSIMDFHGVKIGISSDGIGTKIELAERSGIYDTIGFDLVAMVADDLAANGIETVNFSNILDVDNLDADVVDQLMKGLYEATSFSRITVTGGEIAELGSRIGGYGAGMHFNWGATGIGILPQGQEIIDGRSVKEGDTIISLKSRGFRSNGYSLVRRIMETQFGPEWHSAKYDDNKTWGETLLTPSWIYSPLIADLLKAGVIINGISHITGGGIADNFSRVLKATQLGAEFDDLHEPLPFMTKVQQMGDVAEEQAYRLWNMGNGMLLVVDRAKANRCLELIEEKKYTGRVCGSIVKEKLITIQTKGCQPQRLASRY